MREDQSRSPGGQRCRGLQIEPLPPHAAGPHANAADTPRGLTPCLQEKYIVLPQGSGGAPCAPRGADATPGLDAASGVTYPKLQSAGGPPALICDVVIPTRDRPAALRGAVASALAALPCASAGVIVVDNASRPPASEALAKIRDPRLRIVVNPGPHGPAAARNFGVAQSRAATVFFLDDDDALLPDYIARIEARRVGRARAARFGFAAMRRGRRVIGARRSGPLDAATPLRRRLAGLGMGVWIERALFEEIGGIDTALDVNEDTEFFLRLAAAGAEGWYSAEPGVVIRPGVAAGELASITDRSDPAIRAAAFDYILTRHGDFLNAHPRTRRHLMRRVIKYRARAGDRAAALAVAARERAPLHRALLTAYARTVPARG